MGVGTKDFAAQVGGHPGVSTSEDGSFLIKPASPREVSFYQSLTSDPIFKPLRPHVPKFYGTLRLEGKVEDGNLETLREVPAPKEGKDSIVLENLSQRFSKPNILDIKLGTVLYDDETSEEKKARMIERAQERTYSETGMGLVGFQIHDTATGQAVTTPRSYGRSLKASDLQGAIAKFFPIHSEQSTQGLPREQLLLVIAAIRKSVVTIRSAFEQLEIRMVGGSFLIIYEGDLERAKQGIVLLEEGVIEGGDDDGEEEDEDEDEGEDEDAENTNPGLPCRVKLIDFAHARVVAGEGPDKGVLFGMDTVLRLLDERIAQIEQP